MPESSNVHSAVGMIESVNNAIRANNDLANGRIIKLWHNTAHLWEVRETLGARKQKLAKLDGTLWRVQRDVTDNIAEVTAC